MLFFFEKMCKNREGLRLFNEKLKNSQFNDFATNLVYSKNLSSNY